MTRIITITLNPAFDIHYHVPQFAVGKENYSTNRTVDAGGKGVNISRALAASGVPSLALIAMGSENGRDFCTMLEQDDIEYVPIRCEGSIRYNVTIHPSSGPETRISQDSFQLTADKLEEIREKLIDLIEPGTLVAFAGRVPKGISLPTIKSFLQSLKDAGALLLLDTNTFLLDDIIDVKPWLIKPNEYEIELLMGREISDLSEIKAAADEIHRSGVDNVLVSLGGQGMVYVGHELSCRVAVPQITPLSTVGAGDSTLAGYIFGYVKGMSQIDTLKSAAAFGTAACLSHGTKPPKPEVIVELREEITVLV